MSEMKKINSLPKAGFTFSSKSKRNQRPKKSEFQEMLDAYLTEASEELETYPLHLPEHGPFWDDGYRDVRLVSGT